MRIPRWFWLSLIPIIMVVIGYANRNEGRIARLEESKGDVVNRLDRIEKKVDRLVEHAR